MHNGYIQYPGIYPVKNNNNGKIIIIMENVGLVLNSAYVVAKKKMTVECYRFSLCTETQNVQTEACG